MTESTKTSPKDPPPAEATTREGEPSRRRTTGIFLGLIVLVTMLLVPPPSGLSQEGWRAAAVGLLMAVWWVTEAIPIPATALVPIVLFPALGVLSVDGATAPYANPIIYLFLGGFLIAQAMQRWDLHKRIALLVILRVGTEPKRLVGGFMLAAGFLSMWVSNTATAVMMLPIGLSVIDRALPKAAGVRRDPGESNFAVALMLGIAYACSIGGLGTLIGTPPNALLAGYVGETFDVEIGFGQWMLIGLPLVILGLPISWLVLTRIAFPIRLQSIPGGAESIRLELRKLGNMTAGEKRVAAVFVAAALMWIFRPLLQDWIPGLSDTSIAIGAALLLFLLPIDLKRGLFVLEWEDARSLPWDVLVLFGGGLSLAAAITQTGLAEWIGESLAGLSALPTIGLILVVTLVVIFLTELTSNTATAAAFLPILGSLAIGIGENPFLLAVPAAIAASCAFMMPVATPPNAIVYGSSFVTLPQMTRAGLYLNIIFTILVTGIGYALVIAAFGVEPGVVPDWAR